LQSFVKVGDNVLINKFLLTPLGSFSELALDAEDSNHEFLVVIKEVIRGFSNDIEFDV
jgi:hypothetical protein